MVFFVHFHKFTHSDRGWERGEVDVGIGSEFWWVDGFDWASKSKGTGHSQV